MSLAAKIQDLRFDSTVSVLRLIHCGCGGPALSHPPVVVRLCGQSGQRSRQVMKDGH